MNASLRRYVLCFLAARAPAAYASRAISARISATGLLDRPSTQDEVDAELRQLAKDGFAAVAVDPVTKETAWWSTDAGVERWTLDGCQAVG